MANKTGKNINLKCRSVIVKKAELSWDDVREIVAEAGRIVAETGRQMAETGNRINSMAAETDRRTAEANRRTAEIDRQMAETDNIIKSMAAETDRRMAEANRRTAEIDRQMAETNRQMAETNRQMAETDRKLAELKVDIQNTNKNINGISDSNGMFAEEYFLNSLKRNLTFAGIHFDDAGDAFGGKRKMPDGSFVQDQFDIVLINDDAIAIIEVKYRARKEDVDTLVNKKVKNFRTIYPYYKDHSIYLGFGAMTFEKDAAMAAKDRGVGLLKQVGETVEDEGAWEVRAY
jgi:hypothetical protein